MSDGYSEREVRERNTPPRLLRDSRLQAAVDRADRRTEEENARRALNFLQTVAANLDNEKLDDAAFREFMRNSIEGMPGVDYDRKSEKRTSYEPLPPDSTGYVD